MSRNLFRRWLLALFLAVLITFPANAAQRSHPDFLATFHGWLTGLWNTVGCSIDPHGACGNTASAPTDRGCVIDPNGACGDSNTASAPAAAGCGIDPHGRYLARQAPAAANQQDEGCGIDPNGRFAF